MKTEKKPVKTALLCTVVFCVATIIAALVGRVIIGDTVYYPIKTDASSVLAGNRFSILADSLLPSALQLAFVGLAGFSVFALTAAMIISLYRGAAFGYVTALASTGTFKLSPTDTSSVIEILPPLILYFLSGVLIIAFSAFAVSMSEVFARGVKSGYVLRYLALFLVFSGAVFVLDLLKLMLL